jgi:hypothetical protein
MANRQALGHVEMFDSCGQVTVVETLTCKHCGKIFRKPGPQDPAGFCHMCFSPVCLTCGASERCDPFEKKLERIEQRSRLLAAAG